MAAGIGQPVAAVALETVVRVRPGERVPMDGVLTQGHSSINQAPVTGESIPVDKAPVIPVFAGTINETGTFEFRVTALASNSTLARIIHAVEEAQATRAPTQGFVERFRGGLHPGRLRRRLGRGLAGTLVAAMDLAARRFTRRWCCWSSPVPARW
jgi:cation transport ATPase